MIFKYSENIQGRKTLHPFKIKNMLICKLKNLIQHIITNANLYHMNCKLLVLRERERDFPHFFSNSSFPLFLFSLYD